MKVDYKISSVLDRRKLTARPSPHETRADTLELQPGMDGLLADLRDQ